MTPKEKAQELFDKYDSFLYKEYNNLEAKKCAIIAVENEYHSLREMLFNLRYFGVIQNEKVYLYRLQSLIDEEKEVKREIQRL